MCYKFLPITLNDAKKIEEWIYPEPIKPIYMKPYIENFRQLNKIVGPDHCEGFVVLKDKELFGLFEYYHPEKELEIGLAINPKYIGKGLSKNFIIEGIKFGVKHYNYQLNTVCLFVDKDNLPAYKAYKRIGFEEVRIIKGEVLMRLEINRLHG